MSKAKELAEQMFPEPQMKDYDDILEYRNDRDWTFIARGAVVKGYNQAEQDLMEKAKQWFTEYVSVHFELETNEDGEPLADSYIQYAKAKLDAANETFENFKQFITEN